MSTRKSNVSSTAVAIASKIEGVAAVVTTAALGSNSTASDKTAETVESSDKKAMGSNNSSTLNEAAESNSACSTPTAKEAPAKLGGDGKRITRNSPMLTTSPSGASGNKKTNITSLDANESDKESEESVAAGNKKTLTSQVKGRKNLKDSDMEVDTKEKHSEKEVKKVASTSSSEVKDKDTTRSSPSVSNSTIAVRQTRKAAAQVLASKQRITRNRQSSGGANVSRSETPPLNSFARNRRPAAVKMPLPIVEPAPKRKRSHDDAPSSGVEPGLKYIKTEIKEEVVETSSLADEDQVSNISEHDLIKIKQEVEENSEDITADAESSSKPTTGSKGRWASRKSSNDLKSVQTSPSTRATRQTKPSSPSPSSSSNEPKRRRTTGNALRRSSSQSLLKTSVGSLIQSTHDEDSKDSINSEEVVIKIEKNSEDFEELPEDKPEVNSNGSDNCMEPISVQTEQIQETADACSSSSTPTKTASPENINKASSEKAASLSPELISEGVSEISVKQFYKKPEFLENNLGIEEDPKLGEIVQKVSHNVTEKTVKNVTDAEEEDKITDDSFSSESLKEGELRFDESSDEQKKATPSSELLNDEDNTEANEKENGIEILKELEKNKEESPKNVEDDLVKNQQEVDIVEDEDEEENESETISMDNNASLHEEAMEEELQEVPEEELEETEEVATLEIEDIELVQSNDSHSKDMPLEADGEVDQSDAELNKDVSEIIKEPCDITDEAKLNLNSEIPLVKVNDETKPMSEQAIELSLTSIVEASKETEDVLAKIDAKLETIDKKCNEELTIVDENKENMVLLETKEDLKLEDIKLMDSMESGDLNEATTSKAEDDLLDEKPDNKRKCTDVVVLQAEPKKNKKSNVKDLDYMEILPGESEDIIKAKQQLRELELLTSKRDKRVSLYKEGKLLLFISNN